MTTFQREILTEELILEMVPLMLHHKDEVCAYDDLQFSPQWSMYLALEAANVLRAYTARKAGCLIGYTVFTLTQHTHYQDEILGAQDVIYLKPENRKGTLGTKLIKYTDRELEKDGATIINYNVTEMNNFGPVLERIGYGPLSTIFSRRIN